MPQAFSDLIWKQNFSISGHWTVQGEWLQACSAAAAEGAQGLQARGPGALASAAGHLQWCWQRLCQLPQRLGLVSSSQPS